MRRLLAGVGAAGLWLGLAAGASAQDSINAFGGFPTGMYMPAAPSGVVYSSPVAAYPTTYSYRPYGATSVAPGVTYYSSGYSTGVAPGAAYYSYPAYGYTTYRYPVYNYRRGLFGRRSVWGW